jgi:hypothetical protein
MLDGTLRDQLLLEEPLLADDPTEPVSAASSANIRAALHKVLEQLMSLETISVLRGRSSQSIDLTDSPK